MGSLGGSKKSAPAKKTAKVQPTSLFTPFGDVNASLSKVTLVDKTPDVVKNSIDLAGQKENDIIRGLSTQTGPDQLFNNPFTLALREQLGGNFEEMARQQTNNTARQMAARRNLDNSAGIYAMQQQQEGQNRTRANIDAQATLGGADVFTQSLQNSLALLQNLQQNRMANIEQAMAPLKLAAGYQSTLNPLITAQAGIDLQNQQQKAQPKSGLFGSIGSLFGLAG